MNAAPAARRPPDASAHGWPLREPAAAGFDPQALAAGIARFEGAAPHDGVRKLLVARDGAVVHAGPEAHVAQGAYSITKTFLSTVMGLLYDDGRFRPDQPAADVLPELRAAFPEATFGQFLSMTSGYRAADDDRPVNAYRHGPSRTPFRPAATPQNPPGTAYSYWDSAPTMLALGATRLAGEPLDALFRRRVGAVVGIDVEWGAWLHEGMRINGGSGNWYGPVQVTPFDLLKLGELYRLDGAWRGRQVLSRDWCRLATSVQVPVELGQEGELFQGRGVYGYFWWVQGRKPDGALKWPGLETRLFSAAGLNNNDLFVLPKHGLVVLRMGHDEDTGRQVDDATYAALLRGIVDAITEGEGGR